MGESPEEIRHQIEQTRAEMGEVVEALAKKADVKSRAQHKVDDAKLQAEQKLQEAGERVGELAGRARHATPEQVGQALSRAGDQARKRPGVALAVAAGLAGYLLGRARRRKPSGAA